MENYSAPAVTYVGTVEALTAGLKSGVNLDGAFPAHTPAGNLTFS